MYIYLLHICVTIFKHIYKIKNFQYVRNCRKYWVQQYRYIRTHTNYKTYLCYKIRENSWIYKNNPSLNLFEPNLALPLDVRQSDSIVLNILQREMIFLMKYFGLKTCNIVNTHVLLWGDSSISNTDNKHLFNLVQKYIKDSERF